MNPRRSHPPALRTSPAPRPWRSRRHRAGFWAGATASTLLFAAWVGSGFGWIGWSHGFVLSVGGGWLSAQWGGMAPPPGLFANWGPPGYQIGWAPRWDASGMAPMNEARLPLWLPLLLTAAPTAYLYLRGRAPAPGLCPTCAYDLTGSPAPLCPECGNKPHP